MSVVPLPSQASQAALTPNSIAHTALSRETSATNGPITPSSSFFIASPQGTIQTQSSSSAAFSSSSSSSTGTTGSMVMLGSDYPLSADGYVVFEEIGSGAFASVYRGQVKGSSEEVAVKLIDLDQFGSSFDEIRKEIMLMNLLHHPNVARIKCCFISGQDLWIVMKFMQAGSCAGIMKGIAANGIKDETALATILYYVLQGLAYIHKDRKIHRDIKASNILVSSDGAVQLADFGVAGTLIEHGERKHNRQTFTGTPCWMAPEVMEHTTGYNHKADIWSFGITALELAFGRAPYARYPPMKVILLTLQDDPPSAALFRDDSYKFSSNFHDLVSKCLKKAPEGRPTAAKLLTHKFFDSRKDEAYLVSALVNRLPTKTLKNEPLDIQEIRNRTRRSAPKDGQNGGKTGGVQVDSWVFDESENSNLEELNALRRRLSERKSIEEAKQQSNDEDELLENDTGFNSVPSDDIETQHPQHNDLLAFAGLQNTDSVNGSSTPPAPSTPVLSAHATPLQSPRSDAAMQLQDSATSVAATDSAIISPPLGATSASDAYAAMLAGEIAITNLQGSASSTQASLLQLSKPTQQSATVPPTPSDMSSLLNFFSGAPNHSISATAPAALPLALVSAAAATLPATGVSPSPRLSSADERSRLSVKNLEVKGRFLIGEVHSTPTTPMPKDSSTPPSGPTTIKSPLLNAASQTMPSPGNQSRQPAVPALNLIQNIPLNNVMRTEALPGILTAYSSPTSPNMHVPGVFPDVFDSFLSGSHGPSTPNSASSAAAAAAAATTFASSSMSSAALSSNGSTPFFQSISVAPTSGSSPNLPSLTQSSNSASAIVAGLPPPVLQGGGNVEVVGRFAIRDAH